MFLLFLIGTGTVSLNAQVRIGGNSAPNPAAALDLNATDATTNGTKGLALPRVNLTSSTMQLTTGVANLTGMLVYNTTATLGAGIYAWTSGVWKRVDAVPAPTPADSGLFLMSNGSTWQAVYNFTDMGYATKDTLRVKVPATTITWTLILDTVAHVKLQPNGMGLLTAPGLKPTDLCPATSYSYLMKFWAETNFLAYVSLQSGKWNDIVLVRIRCYRPSA